MNPERRLPKTPVIPTPPVVDRRGAFRRHADRVSHEEAVLLARSLEILTAPRPAEHRLAELLDLMARTAGAERAAVLADGEERLVAVASAPDEDPTEAEALAKWLDAAAPRSRAAPAAAAPAGIAIVAAPNSGRRGATARARSGTHFALREIPGAGGAVLGLAFVSNRRARSGVEPLPRALARHAAVALALVSRQIAEQRELDDLRARESERTAFVGMLVHELRTPLTSLRGYLDLLHGDRVGEHEVRSEFLGRSRELVDNLGSLVNDLLEMTRLATGNVRLTPSAFSAAEPAHSVVAQLMPLAITRGISLGAQAPSKPRTAWADRLRVVQILTNLAANGIKFSKSGEGVQIGLSFDGPVAVYVVRDDGPGIADADRAHVFGRFYRAASAAGVTGAGLGLSISRELARAMDGDLDVATSPGRGTSFVLVLPARPGVAPDAIAAALARALAAEQKALESAPPAAARPHDGDALWEPPTESRSLIPTPAARAISAIPARRLKAVDGNARTTD